MPKKLGSKLGPRLPGLEGFGGFGPEPAAAPTRPAGAFEPANARAPVEVASVAHGANAARRAGFPVEALAVALDVPLDAVFDVPVEHAVAVREVLGFPVAFFSKLPLATTLHGVTSRGVSFRVTTSKAAYAQARDERVPVFVGGELLALASAAQNDRMFEGDFERIVERKSKAGEWRLTDGHAFAGMCGEREALDGVFGAMFARLGATLLRVEVHA